MIARFYVLLFRACHSSSCEYLRKSFCSLDAQDPITFRFQDSALQVVHALDPLLHVSQVDKGPAGYDTLASIVVLDF